MGHPFAKIAIKAKNPFQTESSIDILPPKKKKRIRYEKAIQAGH